MIKNPTVSAAKQAAANNQYRLASASFLMCAVIACSEKAPIPNTNNAAIA